MIYSQPVKKWYQRPVTSYTTSQFAGLALAPYAHAHAQELKRKCLRHLRLVGSFKCRKVYGSPAIRWCHCQIAKTRYGGAKLVS